MSAHKLSDIRAMAPGATIIGGSVTIGASGAVSTQTASGLSGGTVTQTASEDGRYGIAFTQTWKRILAHGVTMVGPDDTGMPTTTGSDPVTRLLTTSGFSAQFKRTDTQADTDPASGTVFTWWALVATV
jgi:hypothetical protein